MATTSGKLRLTKDIEKTESTCIIGTKFLMKWSQTLTPAATKITINQRLFEFLKKIVFIVLVCYHHYSTILLSISIILNMLCVTAAGIHLHCPKDQASYSNCFLAHLI